MIPARVDLTFRQGSDETKVFVIKDSDGNTFDLTNYSFEFQAREYVGAEVAVIESGTNMAITVDTVAGTVTLVMTNAETAALDFDTAFWQMEATIGSEKKRWYQGILTLNKDLVL